MFLSYLIQTSYSLGKRKQLLPLFFFVLGRGFSLNKTEHTLQFMPLCDRAQLSNWQSEVGRKFEEAAWKPFHGHSLD